MNHHVLDNPVWNSLNEVHRPYSIDFEEIKFYRPEYCPFGAIDSSINEAAAVHEYSLLCDDFYILGNPPIYDERLVITNELVCLQMILDKPIESSSTKNNIITLNQHHKEELFDLTNWVQPGYFKTKTGELGRYFGIFENDSLIAVAGERMKMFGFTEVSAVVTHPKHVEKGYASQLVSHACDQIFQSNAYPFLHVAATNQKAINLYEKLGFRRRRSISFWHFKRNPL